MIREALAAVLVQVGVWCMDLAMRIDEPSEGRRMRGPSPEPDDEPDAAPPQSPITPEAAAMIATFDRHVKPAKKPEEPLRGSARARREKAAAI